MQLSVETAAERVPVTVLSIHGDMDASNFDQVITKVRELYASGTRYLLLDVSDMPFMGSSGIVAIHSIAMLMRGEEPPDPEMGWQAFHAIGDERGTGKQEHVKLAGPQPKVQRTLTMTGMDDFFDIFADRQAALASF